MGGTAGILGFPQPLSWLPPALQGSMRALYTLCRVYGVWIPKGS